MTYQPRLFKDKAIPIGRDCEERWALLESYLPETGLMFDVGSSAGFFPVRSMLRTTRLGFLSLESDHLESHVQQTVLSSHRTDRICLLRGMMTGGFARDWSTSSDCFDLTLILSVIHWFDDPALVLRSLATLSRQTIIEIPDPRDHGACGQDFLRSIGDPVDWVRAATGYPAETIGRATRHTSDYKSHLIVIMNAEIEAERESKVSVVRLMSLGQLLWPRKPYWLRSARKARLDTGRPIEPLRRNMFWTADGVLLEPREQTRVVWYPGGSREPKEEERTALDATNLAFELRFLDRCVEGWLRNETVLSLCAVDRRPLVRRVLATVSLRLKEALKTILPEKLYRLVRQGYLSLAGKV